MVTGVTLVVFGRNKGDADGEGELRPPGGGDRQGHRRRQAGGCLDLEVHDEPEQSQKSRVALQERERLMEVELRDRRLGQVGRRGCRAAARSGAA